MTFIDEKTCEEVYESQADQPDLEEIYDNDDQSEEEEVEWDWHDEVYHLFGANRQEEMYWDGR